MRSKEDAHDYRYFPDPDLPPLVIAPQWIARVQAAMPEMPHVLAGRLQREYGIPAPAAATLTQSKAFAAYFEATAKTSGQPKLVANWLLGDVSRRLNHHDIGIEECPIAPGNLASLVARIADGTVSNSAARQVFDALWGDPSRGVDALIESLGVRRQEDTDELTPVIDEVIATNAKSVAEYRSGKEKAFNALVGQIMKASRGKADPQRVGELLRSRLD
jgi:aspartyl-tRNA(Asn)/glutamyl-tRNA(Gln) amidotransferase subunit B